MSITVTLTGEEILNNPNDFSLGEYVRKKYWQERRNQEGPPMDDEHFILDIAPDGSVKKIIRPWTCSICGKDTSEVEYDYLVGYDHLGCVLQGDPKMDEKDRCVICGQETPYLRSTNINDRIGYVEGGGQGCYQPHICDKV
jgi:hypothetical protein